MDMPTQRVAPPKRVLRPPAYLTREEFALLAWKIESDAADVDQSRARRFYAQHLAWAVRFAVAIGLRLGELCNLKWEHVDQNAERIHVWGKGEKYRTVPLFPAARAVLSEIEAWHNEEFFGPPNRSQQVFPDLPYYGTSQAVSAYLEAAGLKTKAPKRAMHLFRSTFASWAVMGGVSIFEVSRWLGHVTVTLTQEHYTHLAPDFVSEAARETFSTA